MILILAAASAIAMVLIDPAPAFAWGPVTHIALGVQVLATVITPDHPLQAVLLAFPEAFLYGSLAPDIVQGRRLQSRIRRHSHNWTTGLGLMDTAKGEREQAFALGYLAHLGADVVAHNFFLPARFIGRFNSGFASHIYSEARFDGLFEADYRDLLLKLLAIDFAPLDAKLKRAVDSPLITFSAHRRIFEGGLRRIRHWDRMIKAIGGSRDLDRGEAKLFEGASREAITGVLEYRREAAACRFDPMGQQALRSAMLLRRNLQRLTRMGPAARKSARRLAAGMVGEFHLHLRQTPFGPPPA